jgi:hypothetical protein
MKRWLLIACFASASTLALAQGFEWVASPDSYSAAISESIKIPIQIKNTSEKAQLYVIRRAGFDLGSTQKGYFCLDKNCLETAAEEFFRRLEPGETLEGVTYTLETGLVTGQHNLRFEVFVRGLPALFKERSIAISIDERAAKQLVFQSKDITIQDVYPNPVTDFAFIDYKMHNSSVKARIVIHNILGRNMNNVDLPNGETRVKLQTEELAAGLYFYTLYLDNEGVLTRKLVVRK